MNSTATFRPYSPSDLDACLALFDANCPEFFAPNERADYLQFLQNSPNGYELCLLNGEVAGAFGLMGKAGPRRSLNWILLDPKFHGRGAGRAIMQRVMALAASIGVEVVDIAASHKSAPFFAKFGAVSLRVIDNGWGPGMHRVDMELPPG